MAEKKEVVKKYKCSECEKEMNQRQFYMRHGEVFTEMCKKCIATRIQPRNQSTVLPIMEKLDIPFVPKLWNEYIERFTLDEFGEKKPNSNGTLIGRYIATMNINQYKDMSYVDSKKFLDEYKSVQEKDIDELTGKITKFINMGHSQEEVVDLLMKEITEYDVSKEILTPDERTRLLKKWGTGHSDENLVQLETFYEEMIVTYDIMTPTHEDQLKQIAKLSVQMHELLDSGDLKGYSNVSMAYDRIMKAAKFSAASQDASKDDFSAIGELVKMCEKNAFIPRYHTDEPQDIVDITLADMNSYLRNLVMNELNLETLITEAANSIIEEEREDREAENMNVDDMVEDFLVDGQETTEDDLMKELQNGGYDLDEED